MKPSFINKNHTSLALNKASTYERPNIPVQSDNSKSKSKNNKILY